MTPEMAKACGLAGPPEKMTAYEIGQQINRRGYDAPDTVDPVPPQSPATVAHHRTLQRRPFGGRLQSSRQVPLLMMANVGTQLPNLSKADAHRS